MKSHHLAIGHTQLLLKSLIVPGKVLFQHALPLQLLGADGQRLREEKEETQGGESDA